MDHAGRQARLQHLLARNRLDALLITQLPNIRYLCGFTGSAGVLVLTEEKSVFFTDGRYTEQAREQVKGARALVKRGPPLESAAQWLAAKGKKLHVSTLGVEASYLTVADQLRLKRVLPSAMHLRPAPPLVQQARMVKDQEEIGLLRQAALLGASLFDVALKTIRP